MELINNKNITRLVGALMTLSILNSCEKENVPYNTKYKWEKIGDVEYYHNRYNSSEFNMGVNTKNPRILGIKFPNTTSKIEIYDFNCNEHFDRSLERFDFMLIYDSVKFQDTTFYKVIDVIHAREEDKKTTQIDSLLTVHLEILKENIRTNKLE